MPVVLAEDTWAEWLDPTNTDTAGLESLLVPAPTGGLALWPVSTAVNSPRNNSPDLLLPVARKATATGKHDPAESGY